MNNMIARHTYSQIALFAILYLAALLPAGAQAQLHHVTLYPGQAGPAALHLHIPAHWRLTREATGYSVRSPEGADRLLAGCGILITAHHHTTASMKMAADSAALAANPDLTVETASLGGQAVPVLSCTQLLGSRRLQLSHYYLQQGSTLLHIISYMDHGMAADHEPLLGQVLVTLRLEHPAPDNRLRPALAMAGR